MKIRLKLPKIKFKSILEGVEDSLPSFKTRTIHLLERREENVALELYNRYKDKIKKAIEITRKTDREVGFSDTHPELVIGTEESVDVGGKEFVVHTHPYSASYLLSEVDKLALELGTNTMCVAAPRDEYFVMTCMSKDLESEKAREECLEKIKKERDNKYKNLRKRYWEKRQSIAKSELSPEEKIEKIKELEEEYTREKGEIAKFYRNMRESCPKVRKKFSIIEVYDDKVVVVS